MASVSPPADERTRKIVSAIFQRLSSVGQVAVAERLAVSESTVSRMKEQAPQFAGMLACLGLKVVPIEHHCYDERSLAPLLELAKQRMQQLETPRQLSQDWEQGQ